MQIVRPISDDGLVGYDDRGRVVAETRKGEGERAYSQFHFIRDPRDKVCEICARGWDARSSESLKDQYFWETFESLVHATCFARHCALEQRSNFYDVILDAKVWFKTFRAIDGRYYRKEDVLYYRPWYAAELRHHPLRLEIGWRKRVISIELRAEEETVIDWWKAAETDFADQDVTKEFNEKLILLHAWGYDAARAYLKRLAAVGGLSDRPIREP